MPEETWLNQIADEVEAGASPNAQYWVLSALSCVLATLGLITNSVAVIIGAMLVAPLMGPIMGLSLSSIRDRPGLGRRSAFALSAGVMLAIALSTLIAKGAQALPFEALSVIPTEVSTRARPSFFDLGVALAGGAAGAYAMARMKGAAALIGVAIATALMPPLCSAGIGIAVADAGIARGAFLLFLTNFVAIAFAALAVFLALGFRSRGGTWGAMQTLAGVFAVVALAGLLSVLTLRTVNDARAEGRVRTAVEDALSSIIPGAELLSLSRESSGASLHLKVRVQVPGSVTNGDVTLLQETIADDLNRPLELTFVGVPTLNLQVIEPVPSRSPTATPSPTATATPTSTPRPTSTPTATPSPTPIAQPTPPLTGNSGPAR